MFKADLPFDEEAFEEQYAAYDNLSPKKDGISKWDSRMGNHILRWLRKHRVTEADIDMFYPMGEMIYEAYDDLGEDSKARKMFLDSIHGDNIKPGQQRKFNKMYEEAFEKFDRDDNGRLNRVEYRDFTNEAEEMGRNFFSGEMPEWTRGDKRFFWTMANAVSRKYGMSMNDGYRMERILKKVYEDIEDSSDSESDSDSDSEEEEAEEVAEEQAEDNATERAEEGADEGEGDAAAEDEGTTEEATSDVDFFLI